MPLHVKSSDIPQAKRVQTGEAGTGSMVVRKGYGNECSLMIATRRPVITPSPISTSRSRSITSWTVRSGSSSRTKGFH